jgi:hypothetical protein
MNKKKGENKIITTIDEKHTEMNNYFYDIENDIIPKLKK